MKESFVFYRSFYEALTEMSKENQADCLMALANYALNGEETELSPEARLFFTLVKPQIDANNQRFLNGQKGGRPKKTKTKPNNNQNETKPEPNVNVNVNDNKKRNKKEKVFIPPTIDEVREYVAEKKLSVSPQAFIDYFEAGNWIDSKGKPVLNWKQKILTWQNNTTPAKTEEHPEWTEQQRYIYSIPADISSMDGGWYDFVTNRFVAPPNTKPDWSKFDQVTREFKQ